MKRLPRGVKKNDPRIYHLARNEQEAAAKVSACEGNAGKLNLLLSRAAFHNDLLTAKAALESGADPNSQNLIGEGPMVSLCSKGSVEMLRLFLRHGASLGPDKFGVPPLHHAVSESRDDLIPEMIKAGADVNAHENRTLATALNSAVGRTQGTKLVRLLLDLGADPREVDAGGMDVLANAKLHNKLFGSVKPEVFKLLETALKKWKGKPLPKKPRRRPKSSTEKMADRYIENDPGGP